MCIIQTLTRPFVFFSTKDKQKKLQKILFKNGPVIQLFCFSAAIFLYGKSSNILNEFQYPIISTFSIDFKELPQCAGNIVVGYGGSGK